MVPLNEPWTLSRRNRDARFTMSFSPPRRTTIARKRSAAPLGRCASNSRASKRPIRPKPYSTTSVGSPSLALLCLAPASSSCRNSSSGLLANSFLWRTTNLPKSMWQGFRFSFSTARKTGSVSKTDNSSPSTWRAKRCALMMSITARLTSRRPNTLVSTPRSRTILPTSGTISSA